MKKHRIIDFHTHVYMKGQTNIGEHPSVCDFSNENTKKTMQELGVEKICGCVLSKGLNRKPDFCWQDVKAINQAALDYREEFEGFYIPGFHIHPKFVKESIEEVEFMHKKGVKLVGELVPYLQQWDKGFNSKEIFEILEVVDHYKMIVNFHTPVGDEASTQVDQMVKRFKNMIIVGAHPCHGAEFDRHLRRFEMSDNYYVDVSGDGLNKYGALRHLINEGGKERILYGSDYPICTPGMFVGGVVLDSMVTETEKEYVLYKNAARILGLEQ